MTVSSGALLLPIGLLAELTHRCPLRCPYCSNPTELTRVAQELDTPTWARVFREAAALGCLQVHLSGGEPTARRDIQEIVRAASQAGLYTNLITSGVLIGETKLQTLVEAGLDHVQLSVQDAEPGSADRIGGYRGGHAKKLEFALGYVKREARTREQQEQVMDALRFKCDLLWAQLDALHYAYVAPGNIPPGAWRP